ncbi:MAG: bifunctional 3-(3-hydroxy-phenyl)propionate/3-hydroxycinnamic acid hydroxylase MhpA [Rhizomicrobium sp.]
MSIQTDVIIVGAGPVGATLSLLLAKEGASVVLADKATEIYPLPRAAHIDHEIVRVFQAIGAADAVMAASKATTYYDFLTASGELLMRFGSENQKSPSGWPASNMIHQPSVEAVLRDVIARKPAVQLKTEWALAGYEVDATGVTARFDTSSGEQIVRGRYLVGCDGARSIVREFAQIELEDLGFDEPWLVIDTFVLDPSRLPDRNLQICDPKRPTTCVQMGSGRHRWEFMMKPGEKPEDVLEDSFIAELLKPWNVKGAVTLERKAVYRFHALIAKQWRKGAVFLAGDAAHQTPPFAGQGLCAGVRDAANLAWKLGAVLRGEAGDRLLDTYQTERSPHVRAAIDLALMMGRTVCITDPKAAAERDKAMLARRASGGEGAGGGLGLPSFSDGCLMAGTSGAGSYFPQAWVSASSRFDDVAGRGPWLIQREASEANSTIETFALEDMRIAPFAPELGRWLDRHGEQAVLVRPDRYVFGTGSPAELAQAWSTAMSARTT